MTDQQQSWLRVDHVPGFSDPADAAVWSIRLFLAHVSIGRQYPEFLDVALKRSFGERGRTAFKRLMHELVGYRGTALPIPEPGDVALAEHEQLFLDCVQASNREDSKGLYVSLSSLVGYERASGLRVHSQALASSFSRFRASDGPTLWSSEARVAQSDDQESQWH
ncbi:MAG: hypothetical protein AAFQ99_00655 [Pseudomonadota bacterium]